MKYIISFSILICAIISNAQDVIYKTDKTKIDAKVVEVGISYIRYRPSANPDGPLYVLYKSDISTIVFQNGTFEVFTSTKKYSVKKSDSLSVNFCRNFIGVDMAQFATASIGMTYELHLERKDRLL